MTDTTLFAQPPSLSMPVTETLVRIRAGTKPDPYDPDATASDWTHPDTTEIEGFIASASSMRSPDGLDTPVESSAVLTCPDPDTDVRVGDVIHPKTDPQRRWQVVGIPSADRNPFTGWRPTLEAQLREVRG